MVSSPPSCLKWPCLAGMEYLLAGPQEAGTGRLLVTMQSTVLPWTPRLGLLLSEGLQNRCPWYPVWSSRQDTLHSMSQGNYWISNSEKGLNINICHEEEIIQDSQTWLTNMTDMTVVIFNKLSLKVLTAYTNFRKYLLAKRNWLSGLENKTWVLILECHRNLEDTSSKIVNSTFFKKQIIQIWIQ